MKNSEKVKELPFIVRAIWFFVFGWEITAVWILVAWVLNLTIIGLPIGLTMIDLVPQVLTLKARSGAYVDEGGSGRRYVAAAQRPFIVRAIYFVLIGWWLSLLWSIVGFLLCLTIIGIPVGLVMLNRLPTVTTLQQ